MSLPLDKTNLTSLTTPTAPPAPADLNGFSAFIPEATPVLTEAMPVAVVTSAIAAEVLGTKGDDGDPSAPLFLPPAPNEGKLSAEEWEAIRQAKMKQLRPRLFDLEKNCHLAYKISYASAVGFSALAIGLGFGIMPYAAPAAFIIRRTAIATCLAAGAAWMAHAFNPRGKSFWNDPNYWVQAGLEIERNFATDAPPACRTFSGNMQRLAADSIVGKPLYNALYRQKIGETSAEYGQLRELLLIQQGSEKDFGFNLDAENRAMLRAKALDPACREHQSMKGKEITALGISACEINRIRAAQSYSELIGNKISFDIFFKSNCSRWSVFTSQEIDIIKPLAIDYLVASQKGMQEALDKLSKMDGLNILPEEIKKCIADKYFNQLKAKTINFDEFNSQIDKKLDLFSAEEKEVIKPLALDYFISISSGASATNNRGITAGFNFSFEEIIEAGGLRKGINELKKEGSYKDFRESNMLDLIEFHQKSDKVSEEDKALVRKAFCSSCYHDMALYAHDADKIGVENIKAVLDTQLKKELQAMRDISDVAKLGRAFRDGKITKETPEIRKVIKAFFRELGYAARLPKVPYGVPPALVAEDIQTLIDAATRQGRQLQEDCSKQIEMCIRRERELLLAEKNKWERSKNEGGLLQLIQKLQDDLSAKTKRRDSLKQGLAAQEGLEKNYQVNKARLQSLQEDAARLEREAGPVELADLRSQKEALQAELTTLCAEKQVLQDERQKLLKHEELLNKMGQIPYLENRLKELQAEFDDAKSKSLAKGEEKVQGLAQAFAVRSEQASWERRAKDLEKEMEKLGSDLQQARANAHRKDSLVREINEIKESLKKLAITERNLSLVESQKRNIEEKISRAKERKTILEEIKVLEPQVAAANSHWSLELLKGVNTLFSKKELETIEKEIKELWQQLAKTESDHQAHCRKIKEDYELHYAAISQEHLEMRAKIEDQTKKDLEQVLLSFKDKLDKLP